MPHRSNANPLSPALADGLERRPADVQPERHPPPTPDVSPPVTDPDSHLDADTPTDAEREQLVHLEERHGEVPGVAESAVERDAGESDPPTRPAPDPG